MKEETKKEVTGVMNEFCAVLGRMGKLRDNMLKDLVNTAHGEPEERLALELSRACAHMTEAAVDLPEEFYQVMLAAPAADARVLPPAVKVQLKRRLAPVLAEALS